MPQLSRHVRSLWDASSSYATERGSIRALTSESFPALEGLSIKRSLRVEVKGMREPHWHPVTAEMGYIEKGRARMTILDPDGSVDTYELAPGDIGYRAAATVLSGEVLAATFGVPESTLPHFPLTPADPLLVSRSNPPDPVVADLSAERQP